jgi:uracil permease
MQSELNSLISVHKKEKKVEKDLNGKNVVMGLQHTFVMFGATVLVPIITGLDIGVTLLAAGIGTWIFHILTGFKVPVFLGSSFAFIPGLLAVGGQQGIEYALGGIVVAGALYVVVGAIFKFVSYENLHKILPPQVTGPMIILIGLILAPVAINNANGTFSPDVVAKIGSEGAWAVAAFTFAAGVFIKVVFPKLGLKFLSNLPVLLALVAGYILALVLGIVNFAPVANADWFGLPQFTIPKFSPFGISVMVPIAIVTIVEHFGDILAVGNVVGKDFIKDPGITRTLFGDGIATSVSALIGGPATTT